MPNETLIYGLVGFTHGWANVLTIMSPVGTSQLSRILGEPDGVILEVREGDLLRLKEQRAGALDQLIESCGIVLLEKPEWDLMKKELGSAAYLPEIR